MINNILRHDEVDYLNAGFNQQCIDTWKELDYLKIDPLRDFYDAEGNKHIVLNNIYDYWNDILWDISQRNKLSVQEINLCGSRLSGKTYHVVREMVRIILLSIKLDLKVAVYGFRELGADVQEFKKEWDTALFELGIPRSDNKLNFTAGTFYRYKNTNNKPFYEFINGSFIQLAGLNKSNNDKVSLKGLASAEGFDLAISVCEEANEIHEAEFEAVNAAIRGYKQYLKVRMSNPDSPYQYFIHYCLEREAFSLETMKDKGQQFKIIREHNQNILFHYTNYMTNPYLSFDQVNELMRLKELDPYRYMSWGYGIPATPDEAIFARYLQDRPKSNYTDTQQIIGGLDLGQADGGHPTAAILTGLDRHQNIKVLGEYFHSNTDETHLNPQDIAKQIIDFYVKPYRDFIDYDNKVKSFSVEWNRETEAHYNELERQAQLFSNGLVVNVDYGAGGAYMIDILNTMVANEYHDIDWLTFRPVDKSVWFIKDRIDAVITLLTSGSLEINDDVTPNLIRQMNLMKYKVPTTDRAKHDLEIIDLNDDTFDALCYSIMPMLKSTLDTIKTKDWFNAYKGRN